MSKIAGDINHHMMRNAKTRAINAPALDLIADILEQHTAGILAGVKEHMDKRNSEARSAGFDAADMATAAAQGFRDGVASVAASAGSEPVAWAIFAEGGNIRLWSKKPLLHPSAQPLYTHLSPPEGMAGWISVKDRLPEKNTEVLICFAELSIPSTGQYTASALDHEGWCYPQENRLWPGEHPDFEDGSSPTVTHWMPLPTAPGPADGESNG